MMLRTYLEIKSNFEVTCQMSIYFLPKRRYNGYTDLALKFGNLPKPVPKFWSPIGIAELV